MSHESICLLPSGENSEDVKVSQQNGRLDRQSTKQVDRWNELDRKLEDLLPLMREGRLSAWDEFFRISWPVVFRTVFRLSNQFATEDAEEVAQDTLATVHASLGTFRGESKFRVWMLGVAWHKAQARIAHQNSAMRRGTHVALDPSIEDETVLEPFEALVRHEDSGRIRGALARLQDSCREVIELRFFAELKYDELASLFGENVKTVGSRLSRCLAALGKLFHASKP